MPWSNQGGNNNGGNGNGGGGDQGGPWGNGPKRPNGGGGNRGGGQQPPDLEDIIKQGQDKIKQLFPSGGGGSAGSNKFLWLIVAVKGLQNT